MGEGDPLSLWLSDVDGTSSGDDAGCVLSTGEGVLLSYWLCDIDGTASGDDAGCAFICNNKNIKSTKNMPLPLSILNMI